MLCLGQEKRDEMKKVTDNGKRFLKKEVYFLDKSIYFVYTDYEVYPLYILLKGRNYMAFMDGKKKETIVAKTTVKRWGNSHAIRLPKGVMDCVLMEENDEVEISIYDGKILIEKVQKRRYLNLQET